MTILIDLQQQKVNEILSLYKKEKEVHFKSPTGSGKTLMATSVISNLINNNPHENFIFVIATISSSDLPRSFEAKINQYKANLPYSDFEVEYIESPSSSTNKKKDYTPKIKIISNKVYIFGKATFGKGRIYTDHEIVEDFIIECKQQGYKVIYIRDEAHIGDAKADKETKTFETLMQEKSDFILKMTATFDNKSMARRVELTERDLKDNAKNNDKWLLKFDLQPIINDAIEDSSLIDRAIEEFKKVQDEYKKLEKLGYIIKPAMLIQVDNEPTDNDKKIQFSNTLKLLKEKLFQNRLSWVQYFGGNDKDSSHLDNTNFTLDKIARNYDPTDCIIFKIGPATGWDIPRACMLLQLRNVCSKSLNIQTIGRIRRNPYPNLIKNEITDKYYIFSNAPKDNNIDYAVYKYKVKEGLKSEQVAVIKMSKQGTQQIDADKINQEIKIFLERKKNEITQTINNVFDAEKNIFTSSDKKLAIKSPILLLKYIKIKLSSLNKNQKEVLSYIELVYQKYFGYKWQAVFIVLCDYFIHDVNNMGQKCTDLQVSYNLLFEAINPDIYTEIFETDNKNTASIDNDYLFSITKFGDNCTMQPLDSSKEKIVADKLKNYFEMLNGKIKIWAKNPTSSNIYAEYLDDFNNSRKSYFDFILKFSNGNYLYLEVKGKDDINQCKTELLRKAYSQYFQKQNNHSGSLFATKIVICILQIGDQDNIIPECFYDKNYIKDDLNIKNLGQILGVLSS